MATQIARQKIFRKLVVRELRIISINAFNFFQLAILKFFLWI